MLLRDKYRILTKQDVMIVQLERIVELVIMLVKLVKQEPIPVRQLLYVALVRRLVVFIATLSFV